MTLITILELLLLLIGIISAFIVTIKYLVRFQRKIDRLLILTGVSAERIKHLEEFLEKSTDFRSRKNIDESLLPELHTDFI